MTKEAKQSTNNLQTSWPERRLSELVTFEKGRVVTCQSFPDCDSVPYIGADSFGGIFNQFTRDPGVILSDPSDVLMLWDGERSGLCATGLRGAIGSTVARLRPRPSINGRFLYHQLVRNFPWIQARRTGTGVPHVPRDLGTALFLPFPSDITEQSRIAVILDTVDEAITKTEAVIAKLKQVRAGLLHDLLTRGLDEHGQLRDPIAHPEQFKDSPLGRIPREWEIKPLEQCCSDIVDCPHSTPQYRDEGVLVARTMHIKDGQFDVQAASRVSEDEYDQRIARLEPRPGDLIFTREAPVGEAFVIPTGMRICLGQRVMLLRPRSNDLFGTYLVAQIYSGAVRRRIDSLTGGTTNPHLNVAEVRGFQVPIPLPCKQEMIAGTLDALERSLGAEQQAQNKLFKLKSALMSDLLTGRVRVPVDIFKENP